MNAEDAMKYAAAILWERLEWALDEIGGAGCDQDGHELSLDALHDVGVRIGRLAARFGNVNTYSDGRAVRTSQDIEEGVYTSHVWHPNVHEDTVHTWRGSLRHDPDEPSPGVYEVTCEPTTQEIHVRVVRLVQ